MKYLFIKLPNLNQTETADFEYRLFGNVHYLDCGQCDDEESCFEYVERQCLYLENGELPTLDLFNNPTIVLLANFKGDSEYEVELLSFNAEVRDNYELSNKLEVYLQQEVKPSTPERNSKTQAKKSLEEHIEAEPQYELELSVCQELTFENVLMELYYEECQACLNLSGKSLQLEIFPDYYSTGNDDYILHNYDAVSSTAEMVSNYNDRMAQLTNKEEQNIAVILGSMIDSVTIATNKRAPGENSEGLSLVSELVGIETYEQELVQTAEEVVPQLPDNLSEYSIFDMYDGSVYASIKSPAARQYIELAFDAYINYYDILQIVAQGDDQQKNPRVQTPRSVMLRRSSFAELIRMFMNDSGQESMSLVSAESIIRKTLFLHLKNVDSQDYAINITDSLTDFQTNDYRIIKLGARKQPEHNLLPVHAVLQLEEQIPMETHQHYDDIGNNIGIVMEPKQSPNGIVKWRHEESYENSKFYIINQFRQYCSTFGIAFSTVDTFSFCPTFEQFVAVLFSCSIIEGIQSDTKKKSEIAYKLKCESDLLTEEVEEELIEEFVPQNNEKKGAQEPLGNYEVLEYNSSCLEFIRLLIEAEFEQSQAKEISLLFNNLKEIFCSSGISFLQFIGKFDQLEYKPLDEMVEAQPSEKKAANQQSQTLFELQQLRQLEAMGVLLTEYLNDEASYYALQQIKGAISLEMEQLCYGLPANNCVFKHETFNSEFAEILEQFVTQEQAQRDAASGYIDCKSLYGQAANRNYIDYSILTADRSVINNFPLRNEIQLYRKWNSLQQTLYNYSDDYDGFTDNIVFYGDECRRIETTNQVLNFTSNLPVTGSVRGNLQDGSRVMCSQTVLSVRREGTTVQADYNGGIIIEQCIKNERVLFYEMLDGAAKTAVLAISAEECKLTVGEVDVFDVCQLFELNLDNIITCDLIKPEQIVKPLILKDRIHGSESSILGFLQEISYENEESDVKVVNTIRISEFASFTLTQFKEQTLSDAFLKMDTSCVVIELEQFNLLAFCFNNSKSVILLNEQGDVMLENNRENIMLRQDGSFFAHFDISADESEFSAKIAAIKSKSSEKKADLAKSQKMEEPPANHVMSSPILLYGGEGFHFSHSILERRKRCLSNVNLNSRLCFEKRPPVMKNAELLNKFELLEPLKLIEQIVAYCEAEYKMVSPFAGLVENELERAEVSQCRIHHELFLPVSDTYQSLLSGVYRFILGNSNSSSQENLFYPSLSSIDWNGNTIHCRLGCPYDETYNQENCKPKVAAKSSKHESAVEILDKYYSEINTVPILPPLITETIQTDLVGEINDLIFKREKQVQDVMLSLKTKESVPPELEKTEKKASKANEKQEEDEKKPQIDHSLRELDEIINELEHIEVNTVVENFKNYILTLISPENKAFLAQRAEKVEYSSELYKQFILEAIPNTKYPSPAGLILSKRYLIIPACPDQKYFKGDESYDYSSEAFCTIENDIPWLVIEEDEITPLLFYTQLLLYQNITNFSTFMHKYVTRISSKMPIQEITGYSYESVVKQSLLCLLNNIRGKQNSPEFNNYLQEFDATFPYSENEEQEEYIEIFNFASDCDEENWKLLEKTKQEWQQIVTNRNQMIAKEQKEQNLAGYGVISELADIAREVLEQQRFEREQQEKMIIEQKIQEEEEKQREYEILQEQVNSEKPKEYDHLIDKPLQEGEKHKKDNTVKKQVGPFLSPRNEQEDEEDEDNISYHHYKFGLSSIVEDHNDKYLEMIKEQMKVGRVLPKIGLGNVPGALFGALKIMPIELCSGNKECIVSIRNMADSKITVRIESTNENVLVNKEELKLNENESKDIEIICEEREDSLIKFITKGVNIADVQVIEVKAELSKNAQAK